MGLRDLDPAISRGAPPPLSKDVRRVFVSPTPTAAPVARKARRPRSRRPFLFSLSRGRATAAQSTEPHRGRAHFLPSTGDSRPPAIPRDARGLASRRGRARQRILFFLSRASIEIPSAR